MASHHRSSPGPNAVSMEAAWLSGGEVAATRAAVQKYAQVIDTTESGRDMKPLITGMFEAMDRLKALEAAGLGGQRDTVLDRVMLRVVGE